MLTVLIVLTVLAILLAIRPLRVALGVIATMLFFLLPFAWTAFVIYVAVHFIHKYW